MEKNISEWYYVDGLWINKVTQTQYDKDGYDGNGFDRNGIHKETKTRFDPRGYGKDGFNSNGHNKSGFSRDGINIYTNSRYDKDGYDINGWNQAGQHKETHSIYGPDGFTKGGFSKKKKELGGKRIHKITGSIYDEDGFDYEGYDKDGYDRAGFNIEGYDRSGYGRDGFNANGINRDGKTREDVEQDKENIKAETKKQIRNTYLGLISKAEKLAKGQMTIEEYIMKSKMSIEDLIIFAKKQHLSTDIIRGLYRYIKPYNTYTRQFNKREYLNSTMLIIENKEVKPSEYDVDMCIEYLKGNGILVCDKTVRDTVRGYLRGEIDITQRSEVIEEDSRTQLEILEEEQKDLQTHLKRVQQLESEVIQAKKEDQTIKIGE